MVFGKAMSNLLGKTPYIELCIRGLYYSENPVVKRMLAAAKSYLGFRHRSEAKGDESPIDDSGWPEVKEYVRSLGIGKGDLLIAHTSAEELSRMGVKPNEVLQFLEELVGEDGTLALPSFPLYSEKDYNAERGAYVYNSKITLCSTGMIPSLFMRTKGTIRSEFPWNSLAAKGPLAKEMMAHNLETDLAHGRGSSWEFCMDHDAKILMLGVQASHTTTMVHVAEDILDDAWPIQGWYEKRSFLLKRNGQESEMSIRIRKPGWAKYNASWYRSAQFEKHGLLNERQVAGLNVGYIMDSKAMVGFIIERTLNHEPFFVVPKRCYKNEK